MRCSGGVANGDVKEEGRGVIEPVVPDDVWLAFANISRVNLAV